MQDDGAPTDEKRKSKRVPMAVVQAIAIPIIVISVFLPRQWGRFIANIALSLVVLVFTIGIFVFLYRKIVGLLEKR